MGKYSYEFKKQIVEVYRQRIKVDMVIPKT